VRVPGHGVVTGDIAWGGNWFFLVQDHHQQLTRDNVETLTNFTWSIRQALESQSIRGDNGAVIDHIELFAPPTTPQADSRNFVLCPGKAYDRSPCGTGTSAKMACLHAEGKLQPGQLWRQQGILGTIFQGSIELHNDAIYPSITGNAYVTAETTLIFDPSDPFASGIRP
jgi:4-hydroxyproline epimerase